MSTTYLSKSRKDFKPKAPSSRVASSGLSRGSLEPQKQSSGRVHPSSSQSTLANSQAHAPNPQEPLALQAPQAAVQSLPNPTPIPKRSTRANHAPSVAGSLATARAEGPGGRGGDAHSQDNVAATRLGKVQPKGSASQSTQSGQDGSSAAVLTDRQSQQDDTEQLSGPRRKRRRIEEKANSSPTTQVHQSENAQAPAKSRKDARASQTGTQTTSGNETGPSSKSQGISRGKSLHEGKQAHVGIQSTATQTSTALPEESSTQENVTPRASRRKRQRSSTPEAAIHAEIAPTSTRMGELCKDSRSGRKSKRETRLQERDKLERERAARESLQQLMDNTKDASRSSEGPAVASATTTTAADARAPRASENSISALARLAPQIRLVNGQIVQDEDSRVVDLHSAAVAQRGPEEVREEDELTRRINSSTFSKRARAQRWTPELTERFYDGLRYFGTDFMMMTLLFPGFSRRQLKLKFVKEERADRELVKQVLLHERRVVDLEELQRANQTVFRNPRDVERELAADRARLEDEDRREREAKFRAEQGDDNSPEPADAEDAQAGDDESAEE